MMRSLLTTVWLLAALPAPLAVGASAPAADWTYNLAFSGWVTSNAGNRYHTFTAEAADRRARELAEAGFGAAITSGYHFRLNFAKRDHDIRRIARTIAQACHRHGLKVIEHHDWTIGYYDAYPLVFEHPDWLQLDAVDMMTRHRIFCINNPDFQDAYLNYLRRYQRETDTDAYQLDEIQWLSAHYCGCRHCRLKYRQDTGTDFPPTEASEFWQEASQRVDYRRWMRWRTACLGQLKARIGQALREIRPDVKLFTYTTTLQSNPGCRSRGSCLEGKGRHDDTFGTEVNSVLFAGYPFVYATMKSRLALGQAYHKSVWVLNGQTPWTSYFVWAFGRSCRASLWYHASPIADGPPQNKLLQWPWQMDDAQSRSAADLAILLSTSTRDLSPEPGDFYHEYEGWLQSLCLTHNDPQVLLESQLEKQRARWADFQLIVLPNVMALSRAQAELLLDYVRNGGRLLLTYRAGTLDLEGQPSSKPMPAAGGIRLGETLRSALPVLDLEHEAELVATTIQPSTTAQALLSIGGDSGSQPLLTECRLGRGKIFYLAAKLGPLAFEDKQLPTARYRRPFVPAKDARAVDAMGKIVDTVLADVPRYRVEGAPRGVLAPIYRTVRDGRSCRAIHLLNASGRDLQDGASIAFEKKKPLPMPKLATMTLRLPGSVSSGVLATPESDATINLRPVKEGPSMLLQIPAGSFRVYAVVYAYD